MNAASKIKCPHCTRKFVNGNDVSNHINMKHKAFRAKPEESFADRAIEAQINRACSLPTDDDWLLP